MKLTVKERVMTLGLLPRETNFATLRIVRELEGELSFSEKEIDGYEIKVNDGSITWSAEKEQKLGEKDVKIGATGLEIIRKELKKLDEADKLTKDHFALCEKFEL